MGFLKNLFGGAPAKAENSHYTFQVKGRRCAEIIASNGYLIRKILMGSKRCFQQIEVELNFDSSRQITEKTITNGDFVSL